MSSLTIDPKEEMLLNIDRRLLKLRYFWLILSFSWLGACASTSVMPIAQNLVQITVSAAPACGSGGAQNVAFQQAAAETIRRGYDRFVIAGADYQNNIRVVGHTPIQAHTTGSANVYGSTIYGRSRTRYSGGTPIIGGDHSQALMVQMFHEGEPDGANALSAREILGPDWLEKSERTTLTCLN